jgi:hypothetical protein
MSILAITVAMSATVEPLKFMNVTVACVLNITEQTEQQKRKLNRANPMHHLR